MAVAVIVMTVEWEPYYNHADDCYDDFSDDEDEDDGGNYTDDNGYDDSVTDD